MAPREPGQSDLITVGQVRRWDYRPEPIDDNAPVPEPPQFDEPIEAFRARVERRTGKVQVAGALEVAHPAVRELLSRARPLCLSCSSPNSNQDCPILMVTS